MKIELCEIRDSWNTDYHVIDESSLVIDGVLYKITAGAAWPNVQSETAIKKQTALGIADKGPTILSISNDSDGYVVKLLYRYKDSQPQADELAAHAVAAESIDTSAMPMVTISATSQNDLDAANTKASLESELATLETDCDALDLAAVRPLRAVAAGTATDSDKAYLANNEESVVTKRARIAEIKEILGE